MRSEFFNQIKKNREKYYGQAGNSIFNDPGETNIKAKKRIQFPKVNIPQVPKILLNDILTRTSLERIFQLHLMQGMEAFFHKTGAYLTNLIRSFNIKMSRINGWFEAKSDKMQESFYNRVVTIFEEEEIVKINGEDRYADYERENSAKFSRSNAFLDQVSVWWTNFLISMELDEATNEIKLVLRKDHNTGDIQKEKTTGRIAFYSKSIHILKSTIAVIRGKMQRTALQPIINRFIL